MKRSRRIELALIGAVPLALAACDQPSLEQRESKLLYQSLQQCVSEGKVSVDVCEKAYADAVQAHFRTAPRFATMAECEAQFGYEQCHPVTTSNGSWFMPALAGFMIGRALAPHYDYYDRRGYGWGGYGSGNGDLRGEPIYRSRGDRGEWRTAEGDRFGGGARGPGASSVGETLSRGGFGQSSAARASWGG